MSLEYFFNLMDSIPLLVIVSLAISCISISAYIREVWHHRTQPNLASWSLWALAPLIATGAELSHGVTWSVIPVFSAGFGPLIVCIVTLIRAKVYWKLGRGDIVSAGISLIAILLWIQTKNPLLAVFLTLVSDAVAALPTILKSWHHPETESYYAYAGGIATAAIGLLLVEVWQPIEYLFPLYLLGMNVLLVVLIVSRMPKK